ncbi:MAG: hypothetical protein AB1451_06995 [Nitrospirota bacterium]
MERVMHAIARGTCAFAMALLGASVLGVPAADAHTKGISLSRYGLIDMSWTGNVLYSSYSDYVNAYPQLRPYIGGALRQGLVLKSFDVSVTQDLYQYPAKFALFLAFGQDSAAIEEAFFLFHKMPYQTQLKVGQFRAQFGKHNQYHDHEWIFANPPMITTVLASDDGFKILGAELTWQPPLGQFVELAVDVGRRDTLGVFQAKPAPVDPAETDATNAFVITKLTHYLDLTDASSWEWGATYAQGGNNSDPGNDDQDRVYGLDFTFKYKPAPFSPYVRWTTELFHDTKELTRLGLPNETLKGLYSEVDYRVTYNWALGARFDAVTGDVDPADATLGDVTRTRYSTGIRYFFNPVSRVNLQFDHIPSADTAPGSNVVILQLNVGGGTVTPGVGKFYTLW